MIKEQLHFDPTPQAVADAMMVAQVLLLEEHVQLSPTLQNLEDLFSLNQLEREKNVEQATRHECFHGSSLAITYLFNMHKNLFSNIVLLQAVNDVSPLIKRWGKHVNFLAHGKNGVWYAGSPANYLASDEPNRLTTIHTDDDLDSVLAAIQKQDGGLWPQATTILNVAATPTLALPRLLPKYYSYNTTRITTYSENNDVVESIPLTCSSGI